MVMRISSEPKVYCKKCGEVVYCYFPGMPPEKARKKLEKIHKKAGCDGEIGYMAGIA